MSDDVTYLRRRAETELHRVERATCPEAVAAHRPLAAYLERTVGDAPCERIDHV